MQWNFEQNAQIFIQENAFESVTVLNGRHFINCFPYAKDSLFLFPSLVESGYHSHGDDCASSYSTSGSPVPFGGSDGGTPTNGSVSSMNIGSPAGKWWK